MKIIVGLGNKGEEYLKTRHNLGFMYLEHLEKKLDFKIVKKEHEALTKVINIEGKKVMFVKPQTYMNLSGNAVQKIKKWNKIQNSDLLIIYDDIDIPFGEIRYKEKGSAGTHNGMKSIITSLSSEEISRIRIGIGGIKHENEDLANFVLQKFRKEELLKLEEIFLKVDEKLNEFLSIF